MGRIRAKSILWDINYANIKSQNTQIIKIEVPS